FAFAVRGVAPPFENRQIRLREVVADAAHQREAGRKIRCIQVVEKQPADAALFAPVRKIKIFVAGALEPRVTIRAERFAGGARGAMPVQYVFDERVIRRQIEAATKPPDRLAALV